MTRPLRGRAGRAAVGEGWAPVWGQLTLTSATLASPQGCQGAGHHERGKWHRCLCSLQEEEGKCGRGEYKGDRWGSMAPHLTWVPGWVLSTYSFIEE